MHHNPIRLVIASSLLALLALTSCSSDTNETEATVLEADSVAAGAPSAELALEQQRAVIDVRTPEEFAEGHVDGAVNINLQGDDFAEQIGDLDDADLYVVYCRTGNRSAVAAEQMKDIGLDVLDGGAFPTMTEAGWPAA